MDIKNISRAELKSIILELLKEGLLKDVVKDILKENKIIPVQEVNDNLSEIDAIIDSHFDKYDDVFKALA